MNILDAYPSKYLKSSDLQGRTIKVKISHIINEQMGTDNKPVMYFVGKEKGMVCNRINGMTLAEAWGDETDNWTGAEVELFSVKVQFQGKMTDGLRVRPIMTTPKPRQAAPPQPVLTQQPAMPPTPPVEAYDDGFEDVPF